MLNPIPIPALQDNYIWAVHDGHAALAVDPGEAAPILTWLAAHRLRLSGILITHHHRDHTGGIAELAARFGCPVYGPPDERIPGITHPVREGDRITLAEPAIRLQVMEVPGHTLSHVAYVGDGLLFCGDTLFSCGCGRLFEGTPAQMHASLARLAALPGDTLVCCTHEYTLANISFASEVDPHNPDLQAWAAEALKLRKQGRPTLPTTIALERAANPFLRCDTPTIRAAVREEDGYAGDDPVQVFAGLRGMKDRF